MISDKILDEIYSYVDTLLRSGRYDEVDAYIEREFLGQTHLKSIDTVLAVLTITLLAHDKLEHRSTLYHEFRNELEQRGEDVDPLLQGLEEPRKYNRG